MTRPIKSRLQQAMQAHRLPGLAVAIQRRGQDVFAGGHGYFDTAGLQTVTAHTRFGVASLTKLITTMMILLLHQRGDLSVDDLVSRHFPFLQFAQQAPVTLANLLSHS